MGMRESATVKAFIIGILMLMLLIPLSMITSLISERAGRRAEVAREVGQTWGRPQLAGAILLTVPYTVTWTDAYGKTISSDRLARFLPETVNIQGNIAPTFLHRSLFEVPVYSARLTISGHFRRPDLTALRVADSTARWQDATLAIGVGDLRGVNPGMSITWNGTSLASSASPSLQPIGLADQAIETRVPGLAEASPRVDIPFTIVLDLKGSARLRFQPGGKTTTVQLKSSWPDPSFFGAFLPNMPRTVTDAGFDVEWSLTDFGRGYPQAWLNDDLRIERVAELAEASRFGVELATPVDIYQQTERSAKYGSLFILLTFLTFYLVELFQRARLHAVQYTLVGAALCLFYLLLLSLSEHVGFGYAYLAAATATIGVIAMYAGYALGGLWKGVRTALGLTKLYGFLYILLRLEDYALLAGSLGLFVVLATLMYVTRRVNWYDVGKPAPSSMEA
jgi:inner membrane protein